MIHVRELQPEDAPAVARMEASAHDRALADGAEAHAKYLGDAYDAGVNLSFGAFDDSKLIGYVLCYGYEPTAFEDEEGEALYIEDVAVDASYRSALPRLLKRFAREVTVNFGGAAIEAHSVASAAEVWHKHEGLFLRAGFALEKCGETGERVAGEKRYRFRWGSPSRVEIDLRDLLARLPSYAIEAGGNSYDVKVVRDERQWSALEPLWDRLLLATPEHSVFQSYAYQRLWWRHFGGDSDLLILVIVRGGRAVGIAPMRTYVDEHHGRRRRQLTFIGSRWEVDRPRFLFGESAGDLLKVLVRFLCGQTGRWEICELYEQLSGSQELRTIEAEFRAAGLLIGCQRDSYCPFLKLDGSWTGLLAQKSQKFRKNLKAAKRRLAEHGEVRCDTYESLPAVREQLERYRRIESLSWKDAEGAGVSRSDDYFAFYQEMAETFGADGKFVVRMLKAGDRDVAGTFGLVFDGVYYSLQITHDKAFDRCSPGTYLESLELADCFGRGYREYEFLGGFLNNKARWTSTYRYTTQLFVYRPTLSLRLLHWLHFRIKPRVKELIRPYMKSWPQQPSEP